MQVQEEEEASLITLWSWSATKAHLQHPSPSFLAQSSQKGQVKEVLNALHLPSPSSKAGYAKSPRDTPADRAHSPSPRLSTPAQSRKPSSIRRMAAEEDHGLSPGVKKSRSWSRGPEVSWDEMGSLGLHKALNEYYKMTSMQTGSTGRQQRCKVGSGQLLTTLVYTTLLRPVPSLLTPEALHAAAWKGAYAVAVVLYQTAVLTVPLALWMAFSSISGAGALQLPLALMRSVPGLGGLQALPLPSRPLTLLVLLGFLALLRAAERLVLGAAAAKAARTARALQPEQVEARYAGWQLPQGSQRGFEGSAPPSPVDEGSEIMQRLAFEAGFACEGVYGAGSCPKHLDSYEDVVALVLRLCNDAGVQFQGPSQPSPHALLKMLHQAKQAIGLQ